MKLITQNKWIITGALLLLVAMASVQAQDTAQVEIKKFQFIPQELTIKAGQTVRWTNMEKRQYHSVWFEKSGDPEPDYFFPDETYERVFSKPGVYPYRCGPHPKMTGTITVE